MEILSFPWEVLEYNKKVLQISRSEELEAHLVASMQEEAEAPVDL